MKTKDLFVSSWLRELLFRPILLGVLLIIAILTCSAYGAEDGYTTQIPKFKNWLLVNRDASTGLPKSHIGDERFEGWAITYDSAVVILAYIAAGRIEEAKKIADFYIDTPQAWRLGGIIEAVNPTNPALGEDWSVRSGSNLWMGIASFHLYNATGDKKYLDLSKRLADLSLSLQNNDKKDNNYGAIRLGPLGGPNVASDQHLDSDINQPSFYDIFATEHNIDAYALFSMLYQETKDKRYEDARIMILDWLKRIAYNRKEHRLNRGARTGKGIDSVIATDIQSWGISALGVDVLNTFENDLAEKMIVFVEENCVSEVSYNKPNGQKVCVRGADFIDKGSAADLKRAPIVSPEWTFQLINAYKRLEDYFKEHNDHHKETEYQQKRQKLTESILGMALESGDTLSFPYASEPEAQIGHEYKTPKEGNVSTIGVAYAVLALSGFDPLVYSKNP